MVIVQSLSHVQLFVTPRTAAFQVCLSFTISQSLLKFVSFESVMLSNNLILCHPFLLLPSIFPSIRVFSSESTLCIKWPPSVAGKGTPLPGPETGLLSNTQKRIVEGDTCADKARDFIGKGTRVENSRVREPRRTALLCGSQSWVLWCWD